VPDLLDMCYRVLQKPKVAKKAKIRAQDYLLKLQGGQTAGVIGSTTPAIEDRPPEFLPEAEVGMDLRAYRDMLSRQLQAAYDGKKVMEIQRLEASFFKANEALMKEEAHLKKMGLNNLEVIDRETLRKILYQLCWSIVRGVDSTASKLSTQCLKRNFPEEVYFEVHPVLMNSNYAIPLLSMAAFSESVGFPKFVREVIIEAFGEFHEMGAEAAKDYEKVFREALEDSMEQAEIEGSLGE